ncbi:FecR family protein [Sphingomonas quercus]|uniref:FecR domain-containing protein n=1 Tax=Sphingomonas quercus TaxID=2842451 RepID=A0ABS6BDM8_9SPHN|nr:FecR domain-containing protein [Sphingomonas quercus]MBU3076264.1 FecR domain-containing protein [Sphingomonas quercus]
MTDIKANKDADAEAAAWYARLHADDAGLAARDDFARWHAAAPEHRRAWDALTTIADRLDAAADDAELRAMRAEALAMAAPARETNFNWMAMAAAIALLALVVGGAFFAVRRPSPQPDRTLVAAAKEYRTAVGERLTVKLADGSRVTLNTASLVRLPQWGAERRVELVRGEAFFRVAKDRAHPFIVSGAGNRVMALGTAFSVRLAPQRFRVALTEGTVKVDTPAARRSTILHRGATLEADATGVRVTADHAEDAMGWLEGRISFNAEPLGKVVAEMNRYSARQIVLRDATLANVPFSGVLNTTDGDALASALESYRIARIAHQDDHELVLAQY